jgi:ferredoxin
MEDPIYPPYGNSRVSYLVSLSFYGSTDHNRIIMDKDRKIITKDKSTIGSSNLVKDGSTYKISDLHDDTKSYADSNYIYTDESEIKTRIRSTNTEPKKVIKNSFRVIVEPSLCIACGSCEILAPKIFVLQKDKMINPKAIVSSENVASLDGVLAAGETCPTKAIKIINRYSEEQIYP